MAASNPNPIPIYASGNRSRGYSAVISSSLTDLDGGDAVQIYQMDVGTYGLVRSIQIYSRGTSNGASVKAHVWFSYDGGSNRDCIKSTTAFAGNVRGIVKTIDMDDITPSTTNPSQNQQGFLMGTVDQSEILYIQIEDASISDGYRVMTTVRDYSQKPELASQD
jgi:hypothetical protein